MEYKMLEDLPLLHEANHKQRAVSDKSPNTMPKEKGRSNNKLPDIVWRQFNHKYRLPFVKRGTLILTANSLIKRFVIANFQTVFSNEILSNIPFKKFRMNKREAQAFNDLYTKISYQSLIETHVFQPGEYLVSLVSVKTLIQFLATSYDLLINQIKDNYLFGFVLINEKNQVPFVWNDDKKLVPLFYFDGQSEFLDTKSKDLVDPWKIWYLQFGCKLLKIREEFYEQRPFKVVDLDDLRTLLPADNSIELCCPEHINQDLLAPEVRVAALHNTTPGLSSKDGCAQTSIVNNKAIEMSEKAIHTSASVAKAGQPAKKEKSTKLKGFSKNYITPYQSAKEQGSKEVIYQERSPQLVKRHPNNAETDKTIENVKKTLQTELTKYLEHMRTLNREHSNKELLLGEAELDQQVQRESMEMATCSKIQSVERSLHKKIVTNCSTNQVNLQPLDRNKTPIEGHYIPTRVSQSMSKSQISQTSCNTNKAIQMTKPILVEELNNRRGVKRKMQAHATNASENQFKGNANHINENALNNKLNLIQKHVERNSKTAVTAVRQIMARNSRKPLLGQSTSPKNLTSFTPVMQTNSLQQSVQTASNPVVLQDFRSVLPEVTITRLEPVIETTSISITSQNTKAQNLPPSSTLKCYKTSPPPKSRKAILIPGLPRPSALSAPSSMFSQKPEWFQQEFINILNYGPSGNKKRMSSPKKNYTVQKKVLKKQNTSRYKSIVSPDDRFTSHLQKKQQMVSSQVSPFDVSKSHSYPGWAHLYRVSPVVNSYGLGPHNSVNDIKRNYFQPEVDLDQARLRLEMQQYPNRQYQGLVYKQGFIDGRRQIMQNACRNKKN